MPVGVVTLSDLRTAAKERADMVNSDFVTTSEWNRYISAAYKELYNVMVGAYGNDYFATFGATQTTDGTSTVYALPADFYKLLGVDQQIAGQWLNVPPFSLADRNVHSAFSGQPAPAGIPFRLIYIPRPAALTLDADTVDGVAGWENYIVVRAAITALMKEESDVSNLSGELLAIKSQIESMAEGRDAGNPPSGVDALGGNGDSGFGGPYAYREEFIAQPNLRYRLSGSNLWLISGAF